MGWAEPVTLDIENANVNLVTNLAAGISDTVILKIPLNSSEYFLVENRNRDANNDGSTVTYNVNGNVITRTFHNDTTGYQSFDVDALSGVITDVDEFDWAVPGNGILIWHIDENVIAEKIEDNAINTDKSRRGVDIEEADGVQDIGEKFFTILGDEVIGEGTEEDLWHASNPTELFENRFAKDTRPNTLTNSGANSLITIKDFSEIDKRMSFNVEFGDSIVKPLFMVDVPISYPINGFSINQFNTLTNFLTLFSSNLVTLDSSGFRDSVPNFSFHKPGIITQNNINHIYGAHTSDLTFRISDGNNEFVDSVQIEEIILTAPVININDQNEYEIIFGCTNGKVYKFYLGSLPNTIPILNEVVEIDTHYVITKLAAQKEFLAFIAQITDSFIPDHLYWSTEGQFIFHDEIPIYITATKDANGNNIAIVYTDAKKFYQIDKGEIISEFYVNSELILKSFALTDLKQDGTNYIVVNNGDNIEVYNLTGALADNFPFTDPQGIGFVGTPLTADFEGDNNSEIISVTEDGRIFAIDGGTGKVVPGFKW